MSMTDVEAANLSEAAFQERRTVGGAAMEGRFKTVGSDRVRLGSNSEAAFAREIAQRRGGAVVDIEIAQVDNVDHKALGRPTDKQYENSKNMVMTRLNMTGWASATVISCLPKVLTSDSTMEPLRKAKVRPVKDGEEFAFVIFTNPHLEPAQIGPDAPKACYDFQPIQLAKEFERVFESHGGVFAFIGSPDDVKNPEWPHRAAWEEKKQKAIEWMESQYREAQSFIDQKMPYGVREDHRACIRRLHHLGRLKTLPEFIEKKNDVAVEYPICPVCQFRQDTPHAIKCQRPTCGYILDARRAYENQVIDETHPALERLTRATVKEMGISDYVAETADEKPERLKAGLPKPKSEVVMRQEQSQEEFRQQEREALGEAVGEAAARVAKANAKSEGKNKNTAE